MQIVTAKILPWKWLFQKESMIWIYQYVTINNLLDHQNLYKKYEKEIIKNYPAIIEHSPLGEGTRQNVLTHIYKQWHDNFNFYTIKVKQTICY